MVSDDIDERLMRQAGYRTDEPETDPPADQPTRRKVPRVTTADLGAGHTEPRNVDADMDRRLMRQYRQS